MSVHEYGAHSNQLEALMAKIESGNVVRLRGQDVIMTVTGITYHVVICGWHDRKGAYHSWSFSRDDLGDTKRPVERGEVACLVVVG